MSEKGVIRVSPVQILIYLGEVFIWILIPVSLVCEHKVLVVVGAVV
jgi:hypothetical protein